MSAVQLQTTSAQAVQDLLTTQEGQLARAAQSASRAQIAGDAQPMQDQQARALQAGAVMRTHAKSFAWAARFLSPDARSDAAVLYALARAADDWADEEALGSLSARMLQLHSLRDQTLGLDLANHSVLPSTFTVAGSQQHSARNDAGSLLHAHAVPPEVTRYFFDSLEADAQPRSLRSSAALLAFCYGVAGTVGLMMCPILGAPHSARRSACLLGMAMQLTNIARDVVEDAARGRCYVPSDWGVPARCLAAPQSDAERRAAFAAIAQLLGMAEQLYAMAQPGIADIPRANQRAIRVALYLYRGIGRKILRLGAQQYWQSRAIVSPLEKAWLVLRVVLQSNASAASASVPEPASAQLPRPQHAQLESDLAQIAHLPGLHGLL